MRSNIILIGMPYSGKTTVGKALSKRIGCNFIDFDFMIEEKYRIPISDIFKIYGEEYFRMIERETLLALISSSCENTVISTGGGLPIFYDNIEIIKKLGISFFLDTPLEIIKQRAYENNNRPLVQKNLEKNLVTLYNKRISIYNEADIIIKTENMVTESIVDYMMKIMEKFKETNNNICK